MLVICPKCGDLPSCTSTDNSIVTSRYTILTFLPKQVIIQFGKLANFYFLSVALLQFIPGLSTIGPTAIIPLTVFLLACMVREAYDDVRRSRNDQEENHRKTKVLHYQGWTEMESTVYWKNLEPGALIKLYCNEQVPADILIIKTSDSETGLAYVETVNLDGETNLKVKHSIHSVSEIQKSDIQLEVEDSNSDIYSFQGIACNLKSKMKYPIGIDNLLLRGSILKNTKWVHGMVVYCGENTKIRKSAANKRNKSKISVTESYLTNRFVIIFFLIVILLSFVSYFLNPKGDTSFFSFIILFNNIIPVSLYVTLELIKLVQAFFIENDLQMFDEKSCKSAQVHTSTLNEDLGQIHQLFSDKTGTLTENEMVLKRISGNGGYVSKDPNHEQRLLLEALMLCHSVIIDEHGQLESTSPDEVAILKGMENFGYHFNGKKTNGYVGFRVNEENYLYKLEVVLEFTSSRKCMSTIYRGKDDGYFLICKGADEVMLGKCSNISRCADDLKNLEEMAEQGLRTLLVAYRKLSNEEFRDLEIMYSKAHDVLEKRSQLMDAIINEYERNLELIGITGVEDRLQEGVPETVDMIRKAGIKIWVLSGDKKETVLNVCLASKIISAAAKIYTWPCSEPESTTAFYLCVEGNEVQSMLEKTDVGKRFIILAEKAVSVICYRMSPQQKGFIISLCNSHSFAGNRWIFKPLINCAIGDGANGKLEIEIPQRDDDVCMLQEANIGISVMGKEGSHAQMVSDYSIAKFCHLQSLVLVHGNWNYCRNSNYLIGSFYKMLVFFLTLFYYQFYCGFSGSSMYENWTLAMYNEVWSLGVVVAAALFDREYSREYILRNPQVYRIGPLFSKYNPEKILLMIVISFFQSFITVYMTAEMWPSLREDYGLYGYGIFCYSCMIVIVNLRLFVFNCKTWVWPISATFWSIILLWFFVFQPFYQVDEVQGVYFWLFFDPALYLTGFLICIICCFVPEALVHIFSSYFDL